MAPPFTPAILAAVVALVCTVLHPGIADAGTTGAITGTVIDASTQIRVVAARVTATSPSQTSSTETDRGGRFAFTSLTPDTYTLSVAASGNLEPRIVGGLIVQADQTLSVILTQQRRLTKIGEVTYRPSALVKPGVTADVYAINAVTQAKAAALGGGGNLNSAWSALATVPGVYVAPYQAGYVVAGATSGGTLSIRGGDFDQVGYELDGVPVNRSFDNVLSGPLSSLGQQAVQVYTGGAPANAEAQGISGFINQVIRAGTSPAFRSVDLAFGGPGLYNKLSFEAGGQNDARTFSYYVGAHGYAQSFRYADPFNGASLQQLYGVPLGACPTRIASFNNASAPGCFSTLGRSYTNGGATPAYVLGPFQWGALANVNERSTIVNVHVGIPQKSGARDDLQILYDNNYVASSFYTSANDSGGAAFLNRLSLGPYTYTDGLQYNGPTGVALPSNYQAMMQPYRYPGSGTGRPLNATIPADQRDAFINNQAILKLQYQKNFGTHGYLRVYGYTYYSDWLHNGPNGLNLNFVEPVAPDYELSSHTRGITLQLVDQISPKHAVSLLGSYTTSSSVRDNNTQMLNGGTSLNASSVFAALVDAKNPTSGRCFSPSTFLEVPCVNAGTLNKGAGWATLRQAFQGQIATPSAFCGTGSCQWLVVENGLHATYNAVVPKFTAFSFTDTWRPNDFLTLNYGVRYDRYQFQGGDTQGTPARSFWYNAFNLDNCVTARGALEARAVPGGACRSPGSMPAHFTNPLGQVETYDNWQPRIGLTYSVSASTALRASYGRYVQPPNAAYEQYDTLQQSAPLTLYGTYNFQSYGFTTPNHAVRPPSSNNFDLSLEHQFPGDVSFKISPFYRRTQDQIQLFYLNQATSFASGLNVGRQTSEGVEVEVDKGDFGRNGFAARLSFTYTHSGIRYNALGNGTTILDPLNAAIRNFNAYTAFCASNPTDQRCAGGVTSSGVAASPCYAAGAPASCAVPGAIANPYWNAPVQALLDPNAEYAPYAVFPGGIGSSYQSFTVPYAGTLMVQYKHGRFAMTPTLQFLGGQRYGAPLVSPGVAPDSCSGTFAASAAGDPRYQFGTPGGASYDATTCASALPSVDPFTKQFDGIGAFVAPAQLLLNLQLTYDVNPRLSLVANMSNLYSACWGGTKVPFRVPGACGYSTITTAGVSPVGNAYNPGMAIQPILASPYQPVFGTFRNLYGTSAGSLPFSFALEARLKV